MNEEVKILRAALQCLLDAALETADEDAPMIREAQHALAMTSGKFPPNYSVESGEHGKFYPMHRPDAALIWDWQPITTAGGHRKFFYDETKARLYCWQHYQEVPS